MGDQMFSEERTLADYLNVVMKRWRVVVSTLVLTSFGGVVYAQTRPPASSPYKVVVEIGGTGDALIESQAETRARLNRVFIPLALLQDAKEHSYEEERSTITVEEGETGPLIVSIGTVGGRESDVLPLLRRITDALLIDHAQRLEVFRRNIEQERFVKEIELEKIVGEIAFLPTRMRRAEMSVASIKPQIAEIKSTIQETEKSRSIVITAEAGRGAPEQSLATSLLILDGDLQKYREKMYALEERLEIGLSAERDALEEEKKDLIRQKRVLERTIDDIQYRLDHLRETTMLIQPSKFLRKPLTAARTIFEFSLLIGLSLGIFFAFFVELAVQARRATRQGRS